jgi:hypothetical protein
VFFIFFLFIGSAHADETAKIIHDAEMKFKKGEIQEGKILLESLLNMDSLSVEKKAIIYNKMARFYEELVGNYSYAERYSRKVLRSSLPASHRAIIESRDRIKRLDQYASMFREENRIITKMKIDASGKSDAENKIRELKLLIHNSPEYPDLPVAYHYIGKHYLYLEKYYRSYKVLSHVLKTRPGIIFLVPTESLMNKAKSKWHYFLVSSGAKLFIIISLFIISISLVVSKFWEWMNLKSFNLLTVVIIIWALFLACGAWGLNFFIPDQEHLYLETPIFIQSNPFSPGSEILFTIFLYGVLGIIGSFLLTLATQHFKWAKIRILTNSAFVLLFTSSVFTLFYLNNCYTSGVFEKRANSVFPTITGHTYLREKDYEPLILTNPRKYPDLGLSRSNDRTFCDWVNKQYSIISGQSVEGSAKE